MSSDDDLVTFPGFAVLRAVVHRLIDLELRGARLVLLAGGRFRVEPADLLTPDDAVFLRAHRDEARAVIAYQADDSHLFTDAAPRDEVIS